MRPIFIDVHGGDYTINVCQIVDIEWKGDECTISMSNGAKFDLDDPSEIKNLRIVIKFELK